MLPHKGWGFKFSTATIPSFSLTRPILRYPLRRTRCPQRSPEGPLRKTGRSNPEKSRRSPRSSCFTANASRPLRRVLAILSLTSLTPVFIWLILNPSILVGPLIACYATGVSPIILELIIIILVYVIINLSIRDTTWRFPILLSQSTRRCEKSRSS